MTVLTCRHDSNLLLFPCLHPISLTLSRLAVVLCLAAVTISFFFNVEIIFRFGFSTFSHQSTHEKKIIINPSCKKISSALHNIRATSAPENFCEEEWKTYQSDDNLFSRHSVCLLVRALLHNYGWCSTDQADCLSALASCVPPVIWESCQHDNDLNISASVANNSISRQTKAPKRLEKNSIINKYAYF